MAPYCEQIHVSYITNTLSTEESSSPWEVLDRSVLEKEVMPKAWLELLPEFGFLLLDNPQSMLQHGRNLAGP